MIFASWLKHVEGYISKPLFTQYHIISYQTLFQYHTCAHLHIWMPPPPGLVSPISTSPCGCHCQLHRTDQICETFWKKKSNFIFSLPDVNSKRNMHLNEYKQACYWFSGFWDSPMGLRWQISIFCSKASAWKMLKNVERKRWREIWHSVLWALELQFRLLILFPILRLNHLGSTSKMWCTRSFLVWTCSFVD